MKQMGPHGPDFQMRIQMLLYDYLSLVTEGIWISAYVAGANPELIHCIAKRPIFCNYKNIIHSVASFNKSS